MATRSARDTALSQIEQWIEAGAVPGAAVSVRSGGSEIGSAYAGESRPGSLVGPDTLFGLASVSKPNYAAVIMTLVDDGLVALEEPLGRFVPEFTTPAAEGNPQWEAARGLISVRQALAHLTGLPEDLPPGTLRSRDLPVWIRSPIT